jgi:glycerol-3-phosphate dehydrogenase
MGEDVIDEAAAVASLPERRSVTEDLPLHGATPEPAPYPWSVYGTDAAAVEALAAADPRMAEPLHPRLPYRAAEVVWAARHEMACTVEDVLARRTRALVLDAKASIESAPRVAALLAHELGRDRAWQSAQVASYQALAAGYRLEP